MASREDLIVLLEKRYSGLSLRTTEEFDGSANGIWSSAESFISAKDGFTLFDYYTENYKRYDLGVHQEFNNLLEEHGWYAEWYDAGTIMFWPN